MNTSTELEEHDDQASADSISELTAEQQAEAEEFATQFLKKVLRLRGVKIDRTEFLRQELPKLGLSPDNIEQAIASTPVAANVDLADIDSLALKTMAFETNKSAAMSLGAGIPGGFAMLATVPGDIGQFYVHAFRIMQKLAYLYGWQDLLGDLDRADDETVGRLALFLGVMMGVGSASTSLTMFATNVARPALTKQISGRALTKTSWYPAIKQILKLIGIKVTKDSFAKTVTKAVPIVSGVVSGTMTFAALRIQSERLRVHLRHMPPPGVDASDYLARIQLIDEASTDTSKLSRARSTVSDMATKAAQSGLIEKGKKFALKRPKKSTPDSEA